MTEVKAPIENVDLRVTGDALVAEIQYPRNSKIKAIEVELCCVRAADGIRISYDFDERRMED